MARGKKNFPLSVSIAAVDKISAPLKKIQDRIKRTFAPVRNLSARLKLMSKSAGLTRMMDRFKGVGAAVSGVTRRLGGMALKLGAMVVAASALSFMLVKAFANKGDRLSKLSDRLGVDIETLQELEYAASSAGIEQKQLELALQNLSVKAGESAAGLGTAKVAFDQLGISVKDGNGKIKSSDVLFNELADAFTHVSDEGEKAYLASLVFSTRGVRVLQMFLNGSEGLEQAAEKLRRSGDLLTAEAAREGETATQAIEDMGRAWGGVKNVILTRAQKPFTNLMMHIEAWLIRNRAAIKEWTDDFMAKLRGRLQRLRKKLDDLWEAVKPGLVRLKELADKFGTLENIVLATKVAIAAMAVILLGPLVSALYTATVALGALTIAFVTNPIGATITGLVIAGYFLWKHWDKITSGLGKMFGWLWDIWDNTLGAILPDLTGLLGIFDGLGLSGGGNQTEFVSKVSGASTRPAASSDLEQMLSSLKGDSGAGHLTIDFKNMPAGVEADLDPASDLEVDLERGFAPAF